MALCNVGSDGGFSWSPDNRILHGTSETIMWISANGGSWEQLIKHEGGLLGAPQMLPDGESVLYMNAATSPYKIMVKSFKTGESKELLNGVFARYVQTGHIVYGVDRSLYAIPFDMETLEVTGGPVSLVEGVSSSTYFWNYAISDSGTLVYAPGTGSALGQYTFVWVDREGKEKPLGAEPNSYWENFKISPDGTRVALSFTESGNRDIWIWDIGRKVNTRFTFDPSIEDRPVWTPDGKRIIFDTGREARDAIYWKASDGSGKEEKIHSASQSDVNPYSITADGKILFFDAIGGNSLWDIGMLSMEGDRTSNLLLQDKYSESYPQISPDGRWLAYASTESGRWEIYVRPFPDVESGGRWQVSTSGGEFALWSPDGKELYYRCPDAIMAVSVATEPIFKLGTPRSLFQNKYVGNFDIHPDGNKFLMLGQAEGTDAKSTEKLTPKITIVVNWFEELKKRVPIK